MPTCDGRPVHDEQLAFFLTWTTYGTWLPGDNRGWVAKPGQFRAADPKREESARKRLTEDPLTLDDQQRAIVEATVRRHCEIRHWYVHAVACRTNHVHVVVTAKVDPEIIMDQFKAWCTRHLKRRDADREPARPVRQNWWTQRGSKRFINDNEGLEGAIKYVLEEQ